MQRYLRYGVARVHLVSDELDEAREDMIGSVESDMYNGQLGRNTAPFQVSRFPNHAYPSNGSHRDTLPLHGFHGTVDSGLECIIR